MGNRILEKVAGSNIESYLS